MPLKVTRQAAEIAGHHLGTVVPRPIGTLFPPFFPNDWISDFSIDTIWKTTISQAHSSGAQQRTSLVERPSRVIGTHLAGLSQEDATALQMTLMRMQMHENPFPIYSDVTKLEVDLGASAKEVICNVQNKRFYKGQRVAFVNPSFTRQDYGVLATAIYGEIAETYGTGFTLVDALNNGQSAGVLVYPLIDVNPGLRFNTTLASDQTMFLNIQVEEVSGPNTLPGSWGVDISSYLDYYNGNPIFKLEPNWASRVNLSFIRMGNSYSQGRGQHVELHADRPQVQVDITETDLSRSETWDLLRFFDSRRGRTHPFWILQPLTSHDIIAITATYVDVSIFDYLDNLQTFLTHIGFEENDGTLHVRQVASIATQDSDKFRITFTDPFTVVPAPIRMAPAWLSALRVDNMEQVWHTNEHSQCSLSTIQVLDEAAYSIG